MTDTPDPAASDSALPDPAIYQFLVDFSSDYMHVMTLDGSIIATNATFRQALVPSGEPPSHFDELVYEDPDESNTAILASAAQDGIWHGASRYRTTEGAALVVQLSLFPIASGDKKYLGAIARDLTSQMWAEQERVALQEQVIAVQQMTLEELSSPLLPIAPHVILMPIIGSVDTARAEQIMQALLDGVVRHRAKVAIIDITGLSLIDTQVANALLRAAHSAHLIGSSVVLTGIRPEVAQTLVGLDFDFSEIVIRRSLQEGISHALARKSGVRA